MPPKPVPPHERVMRRTVTQPNGCVIFTGAKTERGYGVIQCGLGIGTDKAHRVVYEATVGPIPEGLTLDHLCANPACVNPDHLEPVSRAENTRRQWDAGRADPGRKNRDKTHCAHGHEYTQENTGRDHKGRVCRTCARERTRKYRASAQDV